MDRCSDQISTFAPRLSGRRVPAVVATTRAGARTVRFVAAAALATATLAAPAILAPAIAQQLPGDGGQPGRYSMAPAEGGGFIRLDTATGEMTLCRRRDGGWRCEPIGDAARDMQKENERLREENEDLRAEDGRRGPPGERRGHDDLLPEDGRPGGQRQFNLPSEQDVDQAFNYIERMLRKFKDRLKDLNPQEGPDLDPTEREPLDPGPRRTTPL